MIDINTPLLKAYYDVIKALGYNVYEGEEPDNLTDKLYIVISDVNSVDSSTKTTQDTNTTIQIAINGWEFGAAPTMAVNTAAGVVLNAIKPDSNAVLTAPSMQLLNVRVQQDRSQRYGGLAGRKYFSRIIIFQQDIFIFN